jgi:hypothetical protein
MALILYSRCNSIPLGKFVLIFLLLRLLNFLFSSRILFLLTRQSLYSDSSVYVSNGLTKNTVIYQSATKIVTTSNK